MPIPTQIKAQLSAISIIQITHIKGILRRKLAAKGVKRESRSCGLKSKLESIATAKPKTAIKGRHIAAIAAAIVTTKPTGTKIHFKIRRTHFHKIFFTFFIFFPPV